MTNEAAPPTCPRCREPLTYRKTGTGMQRVGGVAGNPQLVHLYFCERDGFYSLWPDGRLRYQPTSHRPTEPSDYETRKSE